MKKLVIGVLAHVDAGKTTLTEAILYACGQIREKGRVDKGDAFLDTDQMEKERGITIYSKQARARWKDLDIILMDTPGHVDFSAEMERTLSVLDYAVLVISGPDGIQGHTRTLWKLLADYGVPTFLFINKMDQPGADRAAVLGRLRETFSEDCLDIADRNEESFLEHAATLKEELLESYLETGKQTDAEIAELIEERLLFPCCFGSALKQEGIEAFLDALSSYTEAVTYPEALSAYIYKISRDASGERLVWMKLTGGNLKVKDLLDDYGKANQIRLYSGAKYEMTQEAEAGEIVAVTGLTGARVGMEIGAEAGTSTRAARLEPVLSYRLILPEDCDAAAFLPKLRELEEEEPELKVAWKEETREIQVMVMGEVQMEILTRQIKERFQTDVTFSDGSILYKETIADTVEGIGHFEPLRHYAEVHLILKPGEPGSGLTLRSDCPEDDLDINWQRLILTHVGEREHPGVLTGSPVTDLAVTLAAGRAHPKHTEGGDFRQATYRAIRQGLRQAKSVLLEPYLSFCLELPDDTVGRAMTDLSQMGGSFEIGREGDAARLTGEIPAAVLGDYPRQVLSYTRGEGRMTTEFLGYRPCHNPEEIIERFGYSADNDAENPCGSVFCAHGAGFYVPWDEVREKAHLPAVLSKPRNSGDGAENARRTKEGEIFLGTEEIDAILEKTYYANRKGDPIRGKTTWKKTTDYGALGSSASSRGSKKEYRIPYLLVDGYNVIFAWDELSELAKRTIDGARDKLMDILCEYQAIRGMEVIVVFDAYRKPGHITEIFDYHNIHVVYTKEAETADQYIEKFARDNNAKYRITVATSDGLEQMIIRGQGCLLLSSREFEKEVKEAEDELRANHLSRPVRLGHTMEESLHKSKENSEA